MKIKARITYDIEMSQKEFDAIGNAIHYGVTSHELDPSEEDIANEFHGAMARMNHMNMQFNEINE